MKKKTLALFMAMTVAVSMLTGCGSDPDAQDDSAGGKVESESGSEPSSAEDAASDSGSEAQSAEVGTLPLTDDPDAEITVWMLWSNEFVSDPNELLGVQELEKRTGVHVNWILKTPAEVADAFSLLMTSDELPDIITGSAYPGGVDQGIADGVFVDTTDLVNNYMPTYKSYLEQNEQLRRDVTTDKGVITIQQLGWNNNKVAEKPWYGMAYRQELVDAVGYEGDLETVEEWHTLFKMAKEQGYETPWLPNNKGYGSTGAFLTAYGVGESLYEQDGKIVYGPAQEGYAQFLEEMKKWYEEGLINPNFASQTGLANMYADAAVYAEQDTLAFSQIYSFTKYMPYIMGWDTNYDMSTGNTVATKNPVLNKGDEPAGIYGLAGETASGATGCYYISADCENPELVAKWLDYQYTEEGMILGAYGIEGVTYTVNEDSDSPYPYLYTDMIVQCTEHPELLESPGSILSYYVMNDLGWYNYSSAYQLNGGMEALLEAEDVWVEQKQYTKPNDAYLSLTSEEMAIYQQYYTNIETLANEYTIKYITGKTDQSFDAFVEQLYQYGLQQCIDVYQAAIDRYYAR